MFLSFHCCREQKIITFHDLRSQKKNKTIVDDNQRVKKIKNFVQRVVEIVTISRETSKTRFYGLKKMTLHN